MAALEISFLELRKECSSKEIDVFINQKSLSKFLGQKKSNLKKFNDLGYDITVNFDNDLSKYELKLRGKR